MLEALISKLDRPEAVRQTEQMPAPGLHAITPRMVVGDMDAAVEFLRATFGAVGEKEAAVYVDDADTTYRRALAAGATSIEEPIDTPYGEHRAMVRDPFGNVYQIATRLA